MGRSLTSAPLVGRDAELAAISASVEDAGAGRGNTVLLEGPPGIGKTRLAREAVSIAEVAGFVVFEGEADAATTTRPFGPFIDALEIGRSEESDRASIAAQLETHHDDQGDAALLPSEYRIVEELGSLVERLVARGPTMLVLEDLHWADESTLVALRSIARRGEELPLLIVATMRTGTRSAPLQRLVDDLLQSDAEHLSLRPLKDDEVPVLTAEVLGAEPSQVVIDRLKGAAGNPLFITEYLRALQRENAVEIQEGVAELRSIELPAEFRSTILRRLTQLPESDAEVMRIASVLGSAFTPSDLATVLQQSVIDLAPTLQRAIDVGVLEERDDRLGFVHDLLRESIYESVPTAVRKGLHREIGRALADAGRAPLLVAHHLSLGAEERDVEAAGWLRRAARDVVTRSPGTAVELLERASELVISGVQTHDEMQAEIVLPLAWSGRITEAAELGRRVLDRRPPPAISGPLRCGLVYALTWQGRPAEAVQHAAMRTEGELTEWDAALLTAQSALARMASLDLYGAAEDASLAARQAEKLGHELALCTALCVQTFLGAITGDTQVALETGRRAVEIADRSSDGYAHLAAPRFFLGLPLLASDLLEEAEDTLQTGRRIAEEMGHAWAVPLYHAYLGTARFIAGEWDDAIAEFTTSMELADEVGIRMIVYISVIGWLAVIYLRRNQLDLAEACLARADERIAESGPQGGMSILAWARALVMEARGEPEPGIALLRAVWDISVAAGLQAEPWSGAELVRMYTRHGSPESARDCTEVIKEQAKQTPTSFMKGRALWAAGMVDRNAELLVAAVDAYRASPRPHELALAAEDAALVLADYGRPDDSIAHLKEALSIYERLGAERDVGRVRAQLRGLGVKEGPRTRRTRATHGWDSLTKTELKVASLVAERLSNPEIAARLFISRHTVESHLKSIYSKLGMSSRYELAANASQQ